jgi:hypothetical protein
MKIKMNRQGIRNLNENEIEHYGDQVAGGWGEALIGLGGGVFVTLIAGNCYAFCARSNTPGTTRADIIKNFYRSFRSSSMIIFFWGVEQAASATGDIEAASVASAAASDISESSSESTVLLWWQFLFPQ